MSEIPIFYRVLFTVIDPLLPIFGAPIHAFYPTFILPSYVAAPVLPPLPETQLLLDYLTGFFLLLAFLQAVLLRARPNDVTVWKLLQASTIFVDVCVIAGFLRALNTQGRLDWRAWRSEEWQQIVGNGMFGLIRLAFCLGIGMGSAQVKRKHA